MYASEIASLMGGRLLGENTLIKRLSPLYCADLHDLCVVSWPKDTRLAKRTNASCLIAPLAWVADHADEVTSSLIAIDALDQAFLALAHLQAQGLLLPLERVNERFIDGSAQLAKNVHIERAFIDANVEIGPHAFIGDDVVLLEGVKVFPGAIIHGPTSIGKGSKIGSNSVVGFSAFVPYFGKNLSPLGGVKIAQNVEIGALCTIDRGLLGLTHIMEGSRLDNMVHCGHDVLIGSDVIIAGQAGVAGFAQINRGASIGGQAGIAPQIVIGEGARISGKSFAHSNIGPWKICSGNPGLPHAQYLRAYGEAKRYK